MILVIAERPEQAGALAERLGINGIDAMPCARDWKLAVRCLTSHDVSLVLVGVDRSEGSATFFDTLKELTDRPLVAMGAISNAESVIRYLDHGAIDYVAANTSVSVLAAKISSLLRPTSTGAGDGVIHLGELAIDLDGHVVNKGGELLPLTPLEFRLLRALAENAGRACSR